MTQALNAKFGGSPFGPAGMKLQMIYIYMNDLFFVF
jgi:hypothetical protein